MPLVTFKNLCLDAHDVAATTAFWSRALHLPVEPLAGGDTLLRGHDEAHTVWINHVPEPRTTKARVHLDLWAASLDEFADQPRVTADDGLPWTTFADPEGNEFCVFAASRPPGLKDVVVDTADHRAVAAWWADVWGGTLVHDDDDGYSYLDDVPGAPVESFDFVPVPEPKTVKNRVHWDVTLLPGATVDDLVARGATVLALPAEGARWTVMADPEGNEFCVFEARGDVTGDVAE